MGAAQRDEELPEIPYFRRIDTRKKEPTKSPYEPPEDIDYLKEDRGKKFEIFLEELLKRRSKLYHKIKNVNKNIIYKKKTGEYREVDVRYYIKKEGIWRPIFVEAKYTSRNQLPFWLPEEKTKNGRIVDGIDNHVTEIYERMRFAGGYQTVFATNKVFHPRIHKRIEILNRASQKERGILAFYTIEGDALLKEYRRLGGYKKMDLDEVIDMMNVTQDDYKKTYVRI